MNIKLCWALIGFFTVLVLYADTTITDNDLLYSMYLPDNWVRVKTNTEQHQFYDTTGTYPAQLSIVRYNYNKTDFPAPEEWSRANFIAYKYIVAYSTNPWGVMVYYDTTEVTQDNNWAAESFTRYVSVDESGTNRDYYWSEYMRYTATSHYGYELYAMGDTTDMIQNLGFYAAILQGIEFHNNAVIIQKETNYFRTRSIVPEPESKGVFDPLGRKMDPNPMFNRVPSGFYFRKSIYNQKHMQLH